MITVNLLSPEKRRERTFRTFFVQTKTLLEGVLFITVVLATIMIGTKLFLLETLLTFATTSTTHVPTRELERAIRRTNQATALIERLERETTPWSTLLIATTEATPPNVTLREVILNKKTAPHLTMRGMAATRTDLLSFKTRLEKLPFVVELSFPVANLLSPKDVSWQMTATINRAKLTNP